MINNPDKPRARYFHQLKRNGPRPLVKAYPYPRRFFLLCLLLAAVIAAMIGLAVFRSPLAFAQSGSWTTKASMPTARGSLGVGVVGGKLYAVGGFNNSSGALTTVEAYDPVTVTWSTVAPMATPRNGTAVGVVNGLLYAVGGDTDTGATGYLASIEAYDPVSNTWSPRAPMPTPRDSLGVGVVNGKLYALGGQFPNRVFHSTVEAYDPVTNTWTTRAPMPTARFGFGVGVVNNILYVVGGHDGSAYSSTVDAYDPVTDTWSTKAPLPTIRAYLAVAVVNDILYVMGGEGGGCSGPCSVVEAYNPATDTWTTVSSMPTARGLLAAGVVGDSFYAVGGRDSNYLSTVEAFTSEATPTPTPLTCVAPPSNMVSWWPGDGDANDIQDSNNGTSQNGATFAPGKVAQAFSFDGVDHFVGVPDSANLNLTEALTIDAWVNPSVANQYGGIVEKTVGDHVNTQYLLHLEGGIVFFRLIIVPGVDHRTVHSNSVIPINEWTHVAGTWDGATMNLFINGVQQTETVAVTPPINSGAGPTLIGRLGDNIYHFAGLIDEVEIFNRALSTQEIIALYLADSAGKCKNNDQCPDDPNKTVPGICGCGVADTDTDNDGRPDCLDSCPNDPNKIIPGACGCGVPDTDSDGDGIPNCHDNCPSAFNPDQRDTDGDGVGDVCTPFQLPAGGMFVIGDQVSLANGATVIFWGSQWSKNNPLSGGSAPNSFKGFENGSAASACGSNWTTGPDNSSGPPSSVPTYMALIVSSSIQKNGSVISGDVKKIVIVRTNPGYGPSPGQSGTGQVVAILCVTNQSANMLYQLWSPLGSLILPARVELDRRWLPAS
jgi:N-acetylneuraminic acid mutarotase